MTARRSFRQVAWSPWCWLVMDHKEGPVHGGWRDLFPHTVCLRCGAVTRYPKGWPISIPGPWPKDEQ